MSHRLPLCALLLLALFVASTAAAIPCANYDEFIHWLPYDDPEEFLAVGFLVADGYAYAIDGWVYGLRVFDLADPEHPQLVGQLDDIGDPLAKHGDLLVCAGDDSHLQLVDVSDPTAPVLLGSSTEHIGDAAAADGDLAVATYRSLYDDYLRVFDVSGPGAPSLLANVFMTGNTSTAIALAGNLAYIRYTGANARLQPVGLDGPGAPGPAHAHSGRRPRSRGDRNAPRPPLHLRQLGVG